MCNLARDMTALGGQFHGKWDAWYATISRQNG